MTRVASPGGVRRRAGSAATLADLEDGIVDCHACPRLVAWRESVAQTRRRSFADEEYWGRPVPGFGSEQPRLLIVGLAPAAHGANRTGRVFTGDRSGDFLVAAMHRVGLASQPTSRHRDDGLVLHDTRIVAAVRCAPPANAPTPEERDACAPWLHREIALVAEGLHVVVALGAFGWQASLEALDTSGWQVPRPRPRFGHGAHVTLPRPGNGPLHVMGTFHPSQQNTFTGRLTPGMLDEALAAARDLAGISSPPSAQEQ